MTTESSLVQQGRAAIDKVAAEVKNDPAYAARFKEEPVAVLIEAGAPAEGMVDILRETGFDEEDASGYILAMNISPSIGLSSPTAPRPTLGGSTGGLTGRTGGLMDCTTSCSGTCNCSSSCLFTF